MTRNEYLTERELELKRVILANQAVRARAMLLGDYDAKIQNQTPEPLMESPSTKETGTRIVLDQGLTQATIPG